MDGLRGAIRSRPAALPFSSHGKGRRRPASSCARGVGLAHQAGVPALAERGSEELAATGARPRKLVLTGLDSLTASERRVAEMAAQELSNKEIAQARS
jgi:DNA-binding NarL/FixJ family response regulator